MKTHRAARSAFFTLLATCVGAVACSDPAGEDAHGSHRAVENGSAGPSGASANGEQSNGAPSTPTPPTSGTPGTQTGGPDPAPSTAGGTIAGAITVHAAAGAYVFLGDGSAFSAQVPASGVVTFADPSIVGPQNVTSFYSTGAVTYAYTLLAIDRDDVTIGPSTVTRATTVQTTVSGTLRGLPAGAGGTVVLYGGGSFSFGELGFVGGSGTTRDFSLSLRGPAAPSAVSMIGATTENGDFLRVGAVRSIALSSAQSVTQDLTLDRACDRSVAVALQGFDVFGSEHAVALTYSVEGRSILSSTKTGAFSSVSFKAFSLAPPLDNVRALVQARSGGASSWTGVTLPLPNGEGAVIATGLGTAPQLVSPMTQPFGAAGDGPSVSLAPGAEVAWKNIDASASLVDVKISAMRPTPYARLDWTITAPPNVTSFKIPDLGAQATTRQFPSGSADITVTQSVYDPSVARSAIFGRSATEMEDVIFASGRRSSTVKGKMVTQ